MARRTVFTLVLVGIPLVTLLVLGLLWWKLRFAAAPSQFKALFNRFIIAAKTLDEGVEADTYADNWARVVVVMPMPYVGAHYAPNVRGPYVNTNDIGLRGTTDFAAMIADADIAWAAGRRVVVLTGGSAAFGAYAADDHRTIAPSSAISTNWR